MRSIFYFALIVTATMILAACNAVDKTATKPVAAPGSQTVYADGARRVTADELQDMIKTGQAVVVDVRNQASYDLGHIPGAKLIPAGEILNHLNELPRDKMIVTYCS